MTELSEAHAMVSRYSTTWYEPVTWMPGQLGEAVTCSYLLMRGIDEIEDHPDLSGPLKATVLREISRTFQGRPDAGTFENVVAPHANHLPEVTLRLGEWAFLAPPAIRPRVWETFSVMAYRMADWAENGFTVTTEADLDEYTYAVAGTLVLLLSDLWNWHDATPANRTHAIAYG
ncbi:squalene/phytoene synthase family protein, partial [Streptomyces noursei]